MKEGEKIPYLSVENVIQSIHAHIVIYFANWLRQSDLGVKRKLQKNSIFFLWMYGMDILYDALRIANTWGY